MSSVATVAASLATASPAQLEQIASILKGQTVPVELEPERSVFFKRMLALAGESRNLRTSPFPITKVNTIKGERGVFWVGYKPGSSTLRIGTIKLRADGRCYKPGMYAGMFYQDVADLESLNS